MLKKYSLFFAITFFTCTNPIDKTQADFVIFSYNRPMQLYALLESVNHYIQGLGEIHVIYHTDDSLLYLEGYKYVFSNFPNVIPHVQGTNPESDFKKITLEASFNSPCDFIMYGVDDDIVKDYFDIKKCTQIMEIYSAYAFYLRLGMNIRTRHPNIAVAKPPLTELTNNIFSWHFNQAEFHSDWRYPHTLDMTIYRKNDIKDALYTIGYANPNSLEGLWNLKAEKIIHRTGICFEHSKIVNIPINRVQNCVNTWHMNAHTPAELATLFSQGKKIDISIFYKIDNASCHHSTTLPKFIDM